MHSFRQQALALLAQGAGLDCHRRLPDFCSGDPVAGSLADLQRQELLVLEGGRCGSELFADTQASYWYRRSLLEHRRDPEAFLTSLPPLWRRLLLQKEPELRALVAGLGRDLMVGMVADGTPSEFVAICAMLDHESCLQLLRQARNESLRALVRGFGKHVLAARTRLSQAGEPPARWAYRIGQSALATAHQQLPETMRDAMLTATKKQWVQNSLAENLATVQPLVADATAVALADWLQMSVLGMAFGGGTS